MIFPLLANLDFKTSRIADEWQSGKLPPIILEVVSWLAAQRMIYMKQRTVVTCIFRSFKENKALGSKSLTHVEWRAVDVRALPKYLNSEMQLRAEANERFLTDVAKMVRIPPLDHSPHGLHYHVQASRNEAKRKGA